MATPDFFHQVRNHPFPLFPVAEAGVVVHYKITARYFGEYVWHRFIYDRDDALEFLLECYAGKHQYHECPEAFIDYQFATLVGLTATGTNTINLPTDYQNTGASVDCIGCGARGVTSAAANASHGGGAGAYATSALSGHSPGDSITTIIGAENSGTATDWDASTVKAGSPAASSITGGTSAASVGTTKRVGGNGGSVSATNPNASGGGGAAGPNGVGANAANVGNNISAASGGGGANGGAASGSGGVSTAGAGGNNRLGSGAGVAATTATTVAAVGGTGTNGGGGGGAVQNGTGDCDGGAGSTDAVYGGGLGPGSGGGASVAQASLHVGGGRTAGAGGQYGGGSGGGNGFNSTDIAIQAAGQGLIVYQYIPNIAFTRRPIRNLWRN